MNYYVDAYRNRKNVGNYAPAIRTFLLNEEAAKVVLEALFDTDKFDHVALYDVSGQRIHGRWKIEHDGSATSEE